MRTNYERGQLLYKEELRRDIPDAPIRRRMAYPRPIKYLEDNRRWAEFMIVNYPSSRAYWLGYLRLLNRELRWSRRWRSA